MQPWLAKVFTRYARTEVGILTYSSMQICHILGLMQANMDFKLPLYIFYRVLGSHWCKLFAHNLTIHGLSHSFLNTDQSSCSLCRKAARKHDVPTLYAKWNATKLENSQLKLNFLPFKLCFCIMLTYKIAMLNNLCNFVTYCRFLRYINAVFTSLSLFLWVIQNKRNIKTFWFHFLHFFLLIFSLATANALPTSIEKLFFSIDNVKY